MSDTAIGFWIVLFSSVIPFIIGVLVGAWLW